MHCNNFRRSPLSRREMLTECATGFGMFALSALLTDPAYGAASAASGSLNPLAPKPSHFPGKAKSVILIFNGGAPSHIDLWDPKPNAPDAVRGPYQAIPSDSRFECPSMLLWSPPGAQHRGGKDKNTDSG